MSKTALLSPKITRGILQSSESFPMKYFVVNNETNQGLLQAAQENEMDGLPQKIVSYILKPRK